MNGSSDRPQIDNWRDWLADFTPAPPPSDELAAADTTPEDTPAPRHKGRAALAAAAALVLVTAVAGSVWFLLSQRTPSPEDTAAVNTAASETETPPPEAAAVTDDDAINQWCTDLGGVRDAGDRSTAPGTLVALEHAYYVDRDVDAVTSLYAPTSTLDQDTLAASIEAVPESSHHCVVVRPIDGDLYALTAYVLDADGTQREYRLKAALENTGAGWRVSEMALRKDAG
ncbi:hypothetical protein [Corynebacterium sp. CCM 9203]|uniref:hypothetical protein n=1 Tax=Corynebacterium sp. CCM 9203 TaxID=3057615 RepID=UPI003523BC89